MAPTENRQTRGRNYRATAATPRTLQADGYQYRDMSPHGGEKTWEKAYFRDGFDCDLLIDSSWGREMKAKALDGIVVEVRNDYGDLESTGTSVEGALVRDMAQQTLGTDCGRSVALDRTD